MHDVNDLVKIIKKAAMDAVGASKPTGVVFGKVVSSDPLQITIDQKLTLSMAQLILTRNVTNYEISVDVDWLTLDDLHEIKGNKTMIINNKLAVGENVIMLQMKGGQQYIVLDRVAI